MRILHLLKHAMAENGHVHVAVDLACAQSDAGHEVVLAANETSFADVLDAHGVRFVALSSAGGLRAAPRTTWELVRLVHTFRPDVVTAHMMSSAVLAYPITRASRVPLVTVMHNSFDRHSGLMRLGDVVVAVSQAEGNLLRARGYPAAKVVTIGNGGISSPRDDARTDDRVLLRPCVMTLSGLHPRKAVSDVVAAFGLVAADFPAWHLNVVGWGAERDKLEGQVAELGLTDQVHFLGSSFAPRDLLSQADIFATATLAEPAGLAVMEARAAGCAIVGTRVGGVPETLEQGAAGRLVPVHDPVAFAGALRELMSDPSELARSRRRSAEGVQRFEVRRMAEDYLELYARLVRDPEPVATSPRAHA